VCASVCFCVHWHCTHPAGQCCHIGSDARHEEEVSLKAVSQWHKCSQQIICMSVNAVVFVCSLVLMQTWTFSAIIYLAVVWSANDSLFEYLMNEYNFYAKDLLVFQLLVVEVVPNSHPLRMVLSSHIVVGRNCIIGEQTDGRWHVWTGRHLPGFCETIHSAELETMKIGQENLTIEMKNITFHAMSLILNKKQDICRSSIGKNCQLDHTQMWV